MPMLLVGRGFDFALKIYFSCNYLRIRYHHNHIFMIAEIHFYVGGPINS